MLFDDRLATVLRHRASGKAAARIQFRQLLDLLGNRNYGRDESLIAAAWLRLAALGEAIPAAERARIIAEPGWRFRSAELAAHLAEDEPEVAAAALARVQLNDDDWVALIPRLPVRARGFLRLRRDLPPKAQAVLDRLGVHDRALPMPERQKSEQAEAAAQAVGASEAPAPLDTTREAKPARARPDPKKHARGAKTSAKTTGAEPAGGEISELIARIERFRQGRKSDAYGRAQASNLSRDKESPPSRLFSIAFLCDRKGRIIACDQGAAMLIGKRLLTHGGAKDDAHHTTLERAFARQKPLESLTVRLQGAEAIAGEWVVDAAPRFSREGGGFLGYAGRLRRRDPAAPALSERQREADRIRQMLHELRTPVNAIQGFAEALQQQVFGPAPHDYRALAASIAGDAARILAGFDELDRFARLESGALALEPGQSDLAETLGALVERLNAVLAARMASIELDRAETEPALVGIASDELEKLLWRLLAPLAGACVAGESLEARLRVEGDALVLECQLPLKIVSQEDVFAAQAEEAKEPMAGVFGVGFALRLARAEARAASGELEHEDDRMILTLPRLTEAGHDPSQESDKPASAAG